MGKENHQLEQGVPLVFLGDNGIVVPQSMIFSADLSALDVRVWSAVRASYERQTVLGNEQLAKLFQVQVADIVDSMAVLAIHRWMVWPLKNNEFDDIPQISASKLTVDAVMDFHDGYLSDVEYLSESVRGRIRAACDVVLGDLSKTYSVEELVT